MRAIVFETGGVEKLAIQELPDPEPQPGEVLVRVKACAMNHLDVWATKDPSTSRFGGPRIMGSDVAGVVEQLGAGATGFSPGDRVMISPGVSCGVCWQCQYGRHSECSQYAIIGVGLDGGYAELMRIPVENLVPLPENLSFEEGASIPLVFITAWHMLTEKAKVRAGEWVLVNAAGSGVGIAAIQVAKLMGARVIATASTEEKRGRAMALGADEVVDYTQAEWAQEVVRLTGGRGVDVVIENVGGQVLLDSFKALVVAGRLVTCGVTAGSRVELDVGPLIMRHQIAFIGCRMGSKGHLLEVMKFVRTGQLKPAVWKMFPFEQVQEAHQAMISRAAFGKIVLVW